VIVCVGAHGFSAWHDAERIAAIDAATTRRPGLVVPVLLPGAPESVELPVFLRSRKCVDLRSEQAWEPGIGQLTEALTGNSTPHGPWIDEVRERPYRGLQPFTEADAGWMFGREQEEAALLAALRAGQRFITVVGASGSGKSSLVRAGIVPTVRTSGVDGRPWQAVVMRPGSRPCHTLALELLGLGRSFGAFGAVPDLAADSAALAGMRERLSMSEHALVDLVDLLLYSDGRDDQLLLVVDQFEELFTSGGGGRLAPEALAFLRNVLAATDVADGRVRVMLTVRADFTGECLAVPELARRMRRLTFALPPMEPAQLRDAIRRPALRVGHDVEKALVDVLVAATAEQVGCLPLLQHTLDRLWDVRDRGKRRLTHAAYNAHVGSLEESVAKRAEEVFAAFMAAGGGDEGAVKRTFVRLVHLGEGTGDTRRRVSRAEFTGDAAANAALDAFIAARLVTTDVYRGRSGSETEQAVELVHDALLVRWSRLRRWIDEDRERLRTRQDINLAAQEWLVRGRPADELWRGGRLARAWELLGGEVVALSPGEREFMTAAKAAVTAAIRLQSRRQRRVLVASFSASVILMLSLAAAIRQYEVASDLAESNAGLAEQNRQETDRARVATRREQGIRASLLSQVPGRELEALAVGVGAVDPEGVEQVPVEALGGLGDALSRARAVRVLTAHTGGVSAHAWSSDGARLATAGADGAVRLWDTDGGGVATMSGHTGAVVELAWAGSAKLLASAGADKTVRIWDGETGAIRWTLTGHTAEILALAWTADGTKLASASKDGTARIWDPRSGAVLAVLRHPQTSMVHTSDAEGAMTMEEYMQRAGSQGMPMFAAIDDQSNVVETVAWSADGARVVTGSRDNLARLWNAADGAQIAILKGHTDAVVTAVWSHEDKAVTTGGRDGRVNIWKGETGERLATLEHGGDVDHVAWRHDGGCLATAGRNGLVRLWTAGQTESFAVLQGHKGPVTGLVWSPDDVRLASAGADGTVRIWDQRGVPLGVLAGHGDAVTGVAWIGAAARLSTSSADGTARLWAEETAAVLKTLPAHGFNLSSSADGSRVATSNSAEAQVWDGATGDRVATMKNPDGNTIIRVALTADGTRLATTSRKVIRVWDTTTGARLFEIPDVEGLTSALAWTRDGARLASAGFGDHVQLWAGDSGAQLARLTGHEGYVSALAWTADGRRLVSAGSDKIPRLWDPWTGALVAKLEEHTDDIAAVDWTADGTRLATASVDGEIRLWDAQGALIATLAGHSRELVTIAWAPNGTLLASAGVDATVRLWSADGALQRTLVGHDRPVHSLLWVAGGARLASAGEGSMRLWDSATGVALGAFRTDTLRGDVVAASPDGGRLATTSYRGTTLWLMDPQAWPARACATLGASDGAASLDLATRTSCAAHSP
jgi:WD40 repeat protein